ncbi:diguanylate cyclase regulator RdcB family protein [Acinetobacter sp. Marseille-Q1623]|uniref:diguanylate cyclase regulator RdcB family protein n=1 Tax=Acinetobacter sp. Marseille-Q1623 TaxID=2697501 RepID=UPI00157A90B5|nr:diguanylate cyclase regulator RdcB family protein [Acinetobacter sp. Marseille-Q1623]
MKQSFEQLLTEKKSDEFQFLNEKLIVDFVNGISVSQDLQNVIKKRSSHRNRFMDAVSGKAHLRQAHLNDHVISGLQACEGWLKTLSQSVNEHSVAIAQISSSLSKTQQHLAKVTDVVIDIREQVNLLSLHTQDLIQDVQVLKSSDAAKTQLDLVFSSWEAGDFNHYSIISKSYIALDNLYWGNFSKVTDFPNKDEYFKLLRNKLIIQLKKEFSTSKEDQIIPREQWLYSDKKKSDDIELIEYMGDWSLAKPSIAPNAFLATQWETLDEQELVKPEIKHLPFHIADISTVADSMIKEFFKVRSHG